MSPDLAEALALSGAVGSGAYMLVLTEIFAPLRHRIARKTAGDPRFWVTLHKLITCPYCTGTWLALGAVTFYRPVLVREPGWAYFPSGFVVSVLFINSTAMLAVLVIRKALGK